MQIALYSGLSDVSPRVAEVTWDELVETLAQFDRRPDGKAGWLWAAHELRPGTTRSKHNVAQVNAAVFDFDGLPEDRAMAILEGSKARGLAFIFHTTHRNVPPAACRFRLVFQLSRPVFGHEWDRFYPAAAAHLGFPSDFDESTTDPSRFWFLPCAPDGAEVESFALPGAALSVEAILGAPALPAATTLPEADVELPPEETTWDLEALRTQLLEGERDLDLRQHIRDALEGRPFATKDRDIVLRDMAMACARHLPLTTASEALCELFRLSFGSTDWRDDGNDAAKIRQLFLAKLRTARSKVQRTIQENEAIRAAFVRPTQPVPSTTAPLAEDEDWRERLLWLKQRKESDAPKLDNGLDNPWIVLKYAPEWRGRIRWNDVAKTIELAAGSPLREGVTLESLPLEIARWFERSEYGEQFGLRPKPRLLESIILSVAESNAYDPMRDYLGALQWDGVSRIETAMERYFSVQTKDENGDDISRYVRAVSRCFFIGAARRWLRPGTKFDNVVILEGPGGRGKSRALAALGGNWFTDAAIDIHSKDSWELASKYGLIELGEMTAIIKSEPEPVKAFLSRRVDTYRRPYGKASSECPRRCLFVGTTNEAVYLRDLTGNRRFWPLRCEGFLDVEAVAADRDQLWAESVVLSNAGENHWLEGEVFDLAERQTLSRIDPTNDVRAEEIRDWFFRTSGQQRCFTTKEIFNGFPTGNPAPSVREIGRVLREQGWGQKTARHDGRGRRWFPPEAWLTERDTKRTPAAVVQISAAMGH